MKVVRFFLVLWCFSLVVGVKAQGLSDIKCSASSAKMLVEMMQNANNGVMPTETDWEVLFATDGYRTSFGERSDAEEWKSQIRTAFEIQFDAKQKSRLDSLVSNKLSLSSAAEDYFIYNFYLAKNRIDELMLFFRNLDMAQQISEANALALKYLPATACNLSPEFGNLYFVLWDGEGRAWKNGTYIDLNLALT